MVLRVRSGLLTIAAFPGTTYGGRSGSRSFQLLSLHEFIYAAFALSYRLHFTCSFSCHFIDSMDSVALKWAQGRRCSASVHHLIYLFIELYLLVRAAGRGCGDLLGCSVHLC